MKPIPPKNFHFHTLISINKHLSKANCISLQPAQPSLAFPSTPSFPPNPTHRSTHPFPTNPLLLPVNPSRSTLINFFRCSLHFSVSLFYHSFIHSSLCYQNIFNFLVNKWIIQRLHSLQHAQEKLRYIPSNNRDYAPPRRTESPETQETTRNRGQASKAGWGSC